MDLDQHELERSLTTLGPYTHVKLKGLLGTYDQGIPWLNRNFVSKDNPTHKLIMWLGSTIGNQNRRDSARFLRRLQQTCMQPGDLILFGYDLRKDGKPIQAAYDDAAGVTREFIMNGLDHVNMIVKQPLFDRSKFTYDSRYQTEMGRHVAHYRALEPTVLSYKKASGSVLQMPVEQGELIHVEYSYKYSYAEMSHMLTVAGLDRVGDWTDSLHRYRVTLVECRPFLFEQQPAAVAKTLCPDPVKEDALDCVECSRDMLPEDDDDALQQRSQYWPAHCLPTIHEWQQLWRAWDLITTTVLNHDTMLFERPIALRHPFIFYLGHIPGFLDVQLSRHHVDAEISDAALTEPREFSDIFERGIDPDMDDPTQCHPHSEVPEEDAGWPAVKDILAYQQKVRNRLERLLFHWDAEGYRSGDASWIQTRKRAARVVWMCFEHEAMHIETLLYMLVQSPNVQPPQHVSTAFASDPSTLGEAPWIDVPGARVVIGHDDDETADASDATPVHEFGWDNEHPQRTVDVSAFRIQTRPVTNGEYLAFLKDTRSTAWPASWIEHSQKLCVKTVFGPRPMDECRQWPAQLSYNEANAYASHYGWRIPTEHELLRFRDHAETLDVPKKSANVGFVSWHPTNVDNDYVHTVGDVWEWTSSIWDQYPGYQQSQTYPGYSADFFDGKHHTVLGGSWATHPRMAERRSFRNWYQAGYPYVFSGFRCCQDA